MATHRCPCPASVTAAAHYGDTLLWNPEPAAIGLAPGIWLIGNGKLRLVYDASGNVASATLYRGTTFDVCAALSE